MKTHHKQNNCVSASSSVYKDFTLHKNTNNHPAQTSEKETKPSQNVLNEVWEGDGKPHFTIRGRRKCVLEAREL